MSVSLGFPRKILIFGIGLIAVVSVIVVLIVLFIRQNSKTASALTMQKNSASQPVTYGGSPIVEACNLLTFEDLRDSGLELKGSQHPSIFTRTYLENDQGLAIPPPLSTIVNGCEYDLQKEYSWLKIAVYQSSYFDMREVKEHLDNDFYRVRDIDNLRVFKAKTYRTEEDGEVYTNKDEEDFILQKDNNAVWISYSALKKSSVDKLLHDVGNSFSRLLQRPEARVIIDYRNSPLKGRLYKACELMTASDISSLLGSAASATVQERYAGTPGTRNYATNHGRPNGQIYIAQECERFTEDGPGLTLEMRQYPTAEGAQEYLQAAKSGENGKRQKWNPIQPSLGDEAHVETDDSDSIKLGDIIYVRKNSLILSFSYNSNGDNRDRILSADATVELLRPVVENVVKRIV